MNCDFSNVISHNSNKKLTSEVKSVIKNDQQITHPYDKSTQQKYKNGQPDRKSDFSKRTAG